jgi:hypothetical protein
MAVDHDGDAGPKEESTEYIKSSILLCHNWFLWVVVIMLINWPVFSFKYLGLPLEASFNPKSIWDGVIEKIECRLASWERMYLSKGKWITLIRSILSNLHTYFVTFSPLLVLPIIQGNCNEISHGVGKVKSSNFTW